MYNDELILIAVTYSSDAIGNQIKTEERRAVLCDVDTIGRREFYEAATSDLFPELVFRLNRYEYHKERYVEHEGVKYRVIRDYVVKDEFEMVELTCERVRGNGEDSNRSTVG